MWKHTVRVEWLSFESCENGERDCIKCSGRGGYTMAKLEQVLSGDFYELLSRIEQGIIKGSTSASWKILVISKVGQPDAVSVYLSVIAMLEIIESV